MNNEILIYNSNHLASRIEVQVHDESVWLNRQEISILFERDIKTIGKHINNVFSEGELEKNSVVAKFATTALDGKVYQTEHYNLDVIISVGYRVKSPQGTQFRIWANRVLKDHLMKGYSINQRMNRIENNMDLLSKKVLEIDFQIHTDLPLNQGVFFDGQTYDAYDFVNKLIKRAKTSIVVIDNYLDDSVITQLTKKHKNVSVYLLSKTINKQLQTDITKANTQYPTFKGITFDKAHDRFMIIDQTEIYHIGASLKDLGKRWFAFSKMETTTVIGILQSIKELI